MRNKLLLVFTVLVLCLANISQVRADWEFVQNDYNGSFNVSPLTHYSLFATRSVGYKEVIDFECTAGANKDVTFFICDEENYEDYLDGRNYIRYHYQEKVVSWSGEFEFPHSDTWYFVFDNSFSIITTKTVELQMDLYRWEEPDPTTTTTTTTEPDTTTPPDLPTTVLAASTFWSMGILVGVGVSLIVVLIIVAIILVRRRPESTNVQSLTTQPSPDTSSKFCKQCGKPLEGSEKFCGECGSKT